MPALDSLLSLESLRAMVYHDDAMVAKMLEKVGEESRNDMQQCWRHFDAQDWPALASSLHRLGGSAQIIYAGEIDDLCGRSSAPAKALKIRRSSAKGFCCWKRSWIR